jgi:hypothetical protein
VVVIENLRCCQANEGSNILNLCLDGIDIGSLSFIAVYTAVLS